MQNGITDGIPDQEYASYYIRDDSDSGSDETDVTDGSDSGSHETDETDGQKWRDLSKQRQFRKKFKKNRNPGSDISKKHVSHILSIEVAVCIKKR